MIDRDELGAWLRLMETPHVGRESARRLLGAFGSPDRVLSASAAALAEVVGTQKAASIGRHPDGLPELLEKTVCWLAAADHAPRHVIPLGDPIFPAALLEAPDPPLLLYAIGRLDRLRPETIAIVGSRNPSPQGAAHARAFAEQLSQAGLTVASGLALGVDAAAHLGAMAGEGGTVAVVGTGLDTVYPRRNHALARQVADKGLILSEYALGTPPVPANFPRRNRIIAGLARGTLVVEAALQSGSLITARLANEAGRDVFAIPGSIHSPHARGCHALIKQGALLVETADDILDALRLPLSAAPARHVSAMEAEADLGDDRPLLEALGHDPVTLDALAARTGWSAAELHTRLLGLELDGRVVRLPGQLFQCVVVPARDPAGL